MTEAEGLRRGAAFAPGHVTGFFEIHDGARDPLRRGSRGAGVCLSMGAASYVEVTPHDAQDVAVVLDKEPSEAPVTRDAVARVLAAAARDGRVGYDRDAPRGKRATARVRVVTETHLPSGQGFGMSGAGALSAALATARALRVGRGEAVEAAHLAELKHRTGLGDVAAQAHGGYEVRTHPGLPPYGSVRSILGYGDVALLVVGDALSTRDVLTDPERREAINREGRKALEELLAAPSVERFFHLSWRFARATGLATDAARQAADAARDHGAASMCMLGNSLFATGDIDAILEAWEPHGETHRAAVDAEGATRLTIQDPDAAADAV